MWQPQCTTVGDDGGSRQDDDRSSTFGHESTETRYSPAAMLQRQSSGYGLAPTLQQQQQQQQHLASLYEQQLNQLRYQQHYQLQQQQLQASGYVHHHTAAHTTPSTGDGLSQQTQTLAPTSVASKTTKIPDDQVQRVLL